ncbi:SapC family protein [Halomonas vilamensis]|uniref:SapC family protein n=1 Tax=Vreelandella vilamensis TaxID=531309 RepID=A0ABU1H1Q8_9GAMM|nr:SapC family protein [Halomonas vilamensis]MDR5897692.1 SapC family protein [Halomonas vilamensis]
MLTLLNPEVHANLRYLPIDNHVFATEQKGVELLFDDMEALADRDIPIILPAAPGSLPEAILATSQHENPLEGYTPLRWLTYPFALQSAVGVGPKGHTTQYTLLHADLETPHWRCWPNNVGHWLFSKAGEPTVFLQNIVTRLQEQAARTEHTHELISLLDQAGGLTKWHIHYLEQFHDVYRINPEKLEERLEAIDSSRCTAAYDLAMRIHQSSDDFVVKHTSNHASCESPPSGVI